MAPAADYLYLSIQTFINTISLIIVIPCIITLVRTLGIHGNCKVLLVTSASIQLFILCVQSALFAYNFITENLLPTSNEKQKPFQMVQNLLFTMSSYVSLVIVLERIYALRHAAEYESSARRLPPLLLLIGGCFVMALLHIYALFWHNWFYETISVLYGIECSTLIISILIIVYARRKIRTIPFDDDRLKAMYQASIREVLTFSMAILPSVIISSIMHVLSLVPTILWLNHVITYPVCCLFYFSIHSLNCVLTKLTLILCHKGMRQRFQLIFVKRLNTPKGVRIVRDTEREGQDYFRQMRAVWDSGPKEEEQPPRRFWRIPRRKITVASAVVSFTS